MNKSRLIAITIIRNEENNFLRPWLKNIGRIADYHIFLDDASDDNTPQIITRHLKTHPGELHRRKTSLFQKNEPALRSELWEYTRRIAHADDWILIVDADEFYDEHLLKLKPKLLGNDFPDADVVKVSCMDMWNAREYRTDGHWSPHNSDTRLIRFYDVPFGECGQSLHMPPYPASTDLTNKISAFIPKIHFAYLRDCDKKRRYEFYTANVSPDSDIASYRHALSIADPNAETKKYFNFKRTLHAIIFGDILYLNIKKAAQKYGK